LQKKKNLPPGHLATTWPPSNHLATKQPPGHQATTWPPSNHLATKLPPGHLATPLYITLAQEFTLPSGVLC